MKVKMWGVRGSIPSPGPDTVRYGGNTTCIEVRGDDGGLVILDAGSGIFQLARTLLGQLPLSADIFISHTHWDHIHGLPFFIPFFIAGNDIRIHGAADLVTGMGIDQVMSVQMQYSYFPIREAELLAAIDYNNIDPGVPVSAGEMTVVPLLLNHPVTNLGYRVECNGKSLFFTGDHEPWSNIYAEGDDEYADYQQMIERRSKAVDAAIGAVDLLICDSSYTIGEYPQKIGWGHGHFDGAMDMAARLGARRLLCTHHEPTRSDDALEQAFAAALQRHPELQCEAQLAREGMEIDLG